MGKGLCGKGEREREREREREQCIEKTNKTNKKPTHPLLSSQAPYHVAIDHAPADTHDAVADAICARASAVGASLVVLPAHNRGAVARAFRVGSVTRAVIDRSPVTVAVMRHA